MNNKCDEELVKVIEDAITESPDYVAALERVIKFKKEHRGLRGFHVSPSYDVFMGEGNVERQVDEANKMAHDVLMMDLEFARGNYKDITNEIL